MTQPVLVILQGGLGNQLFQLSYGLQVARGGIVNLVSLPGFTQHGRRSAPSISDLVLPEHVHQLDKVSQRLIVQTRLLARLGRETHSERRLRRLVSRSILRGIEGKGYQIERASISHGSARGSTTSVRLVLGFWQSWKAAEHLRRQQTSGPVRIRNMRARCRSLIEAARAQRPVMMHVRLGDYLQIPEYGIPSPEYYAKGLSSLNVDEGCPVWVFSDDAVRARTYLRQADFAREAIFPELEFGTLSAAEVLEVMRNGSAYVLGNSTLSWWGAFLSHEETAPVVVPQPWFRSAKAPDDLIPPGWMSTPFLGGFC